MSTSIEEVGGCPGGAIIRKFLEVAHNDDGSLRGGVGSTTLANVLTAGRDAGGTEITNLPAPSLSSDAATKGYVDVATYNSQAASYTLVLADLGKTVNFTGASAETLTIPLNASVAFPVQGVIYVCQAGTGAVTVAAAAGVTLVSPFNSFVLAAQYAEVKLTKIATDTWRINGEVA